MSKELDDINLLDEKINCAYKEISINKDFTSEEVKDEYDNIKAVKNFMHQKALSVFTYNLKKLIQLEATQKKFSKKIGISEDLLSKYKNGSSFPSIETLLYICKIYNVDLDKFLSKPLTAKDFEHIELNRAIRKQEEEVLKFFSDSYYVYFMVTNAEKEGTVHEGLLEIMDSKHVAFKILFYNRNLKKEVIIKQFEGSLTSSDRLIFFNFMSRNDGSASITMMKPNLNISSFTGGTAMLSLPSDANSKPCSEKILISKKRIDREIHYKELLDILSFKIEEDSRSFSSIKISYDDNEKAYRFIQSI